LEKRTRAFFRTSCVTAIISVSMCQIFSNSGKVELSVRLRKSGNFMVKQYGSHEGMNPETGEKVQVKAKKLPRFKVGKD